MDTKKRAERILEDSNRITNWDATDIVVLAQAYLTQCQEVERLESLKEIAQLKEQGTVIPSGMMIMEMRTFENMEKQIATKDAELAQLREALEKRCRRVGGGLHVIANADHCCHPSRSICACHPSGDGSLLFSNTSS